MIQYNYQNVSAEELPAEIVQPLDEVKDIHLLQEEIEVNGLTYRKTNRTTVLYKDSYGVIWGVVYEKLAS